MLFYKLLSAYNRGLSGAFWSPDCSATGGACPVPSCRRIVRRLVKPVRSVPSCSRIVQRLVEPIRSLTNLLTVQLYPGVLLRSLKQNVFNSLLRKLGLHIEHSFIDCRMFGDQWSLFGPFQSPDVRRLMELAGAGLGNILFRLFLMSPTILTHKQPVQLGECLAGTRTEDN